MTVTHDRTPLGHHLIKMRAGLLEWIKSHRGKVPEAEIARAGYLACALFESASNGTSIGAPRESGDAENKNGLTRGQQP